MALPILDATFASAADLPRRMMLAKWLVEELGETAAPSSVLVSGAGSTEVNGIYTYRGEGTGKPYYNLVGYDSNSGLWSIVWDSSSWLINNGEETLYQSTLVDVAYPWLATFELSNGLSPAPSATEIPAASPISNYYDLPERYLWAKIAVAAGGPKTEADYISLPKQYAWKDIYDAVSGSSAGLIQWSEKQALGHIAAAYRGDTGNPANLATYIDWPWRYQVASTIDHLLGNYNAVIVSGAGSTEINGAYTKRGIYNDKPYYNLFGQPDSVFTSCVIWNESNWRVIDSVDDIFYESSEDVKFPWMVTSWNISNGSPPAPTIIPTNV
jgi:hypothetical protein